MIYINLILFSFLIFPFILNAQSPVIDVWYGNNQKFGHLGTAQKQINILGRVSDPQGLGNISTLTYTLNGSSPRSVQLGPNTRRLKRDGDFNIEIFLTDPSLSKSAPYPDSNEVIITVTDVDSNTDVDTVIVEITDGQIWALPYSIAWDTVTNIQNVVQVTDGYWEVDEYDSGRFGLRIKNNEWGYDRAVIFGDTTWQNYEITIVLKIMAGYPITGTPDYGGFAGIVPRWTGHSDNPYSGWDPKAGWEPSGEFTGFVWNNSYGSQKYQIGSTADSSGINIEDSTKHYYKIRVQSDISKNYYGFKWWKTIDPEPSSWTLEGFIDDTLDANKGSILLLAHNADIAFDSLEVNSLPALPVELISFNAQANKKSEILLSWQTATEVNNYGFEIERASGNSQNNSKLEWVTAGFVEGSGNSNSPKSYSFIDKPRYSARYYYRLKQIDHDGRYEYTNLVEVFMSAPSNYSLAQNYPNPFNPSTKIEFSLPEISNVSLKIYNSLGEEIQILKEGVLESGKHTANLDAKNLSSGNYIYVLSGRSLENSSEFRIVKKMTVLK